MCSWRGLTASLIPRMRAFWSSPRLTGPVQPACVYARPPRDQPAAGDVSMGDAGSIPALYRLRPTTTSGGSESTVLGAVVVLASAPCVILFSEVVAHRRGGEGDRARRTRQWTAAARKVSAQRPRCPRGSAISSGCTLRRSRTVARSRSTTSAATRTCTVHSRAQPEEASSTLRTAPSLCLTGHGNGCDRTRDERPSGRPTRRASLRG